MRGAGRQGAFAPGGVLNCRYHQSGQMFDIRIEPMTYAPFRSEHRLTTIDLALESVSHEIVGWTAARADYGEAACCGFQRRNVEPFPAVRRHEDVGGLVKQSHLPKGERCPNISYILDGALLLGHLPLGRQ